MSGLVKAKKYDWKDSNLALFGSDTEKNVKKAAAETEKAWIGAGQKPGLKIWRIEQFEVVEVPKESYGTFYDGDSYIILNTYKNPDSEELCYDVHFWIGKYSTADEYGTAAYKTVELDTYLDDKPVQHREVCKRESDLFKSYFNNFALLKGGVASGFKKVMQAHHERQLFKVTGDGNGKKRKINMHQKALKQENIDSNGVTIIDFGRNIYVINGCDCSYNWLKMQAFSCAKKMQDERNGRAETEVLDEKEDQAQRLIDSLPSGKKAKPEPKDFKKRLLRVRVKDEFMRLIDFHEISETKDFVLDSFDVFIGDSGEHCFVWAGLGVSYDMRKNAFPFCHKYVMKTDHPFVPITSMLEGKETSNCLNFMNELGAKLPSSMH